MKILVIGGTRFMGPHVVRRLSEQGHEITVFHRGQTQIDLPQGVQEILGDRRSLLASADKLKSLAPDVVLDMIPFIEQDARELMSTFTGIARRVVAISSQDVYRAYGRLIGTEPGPPDPVPFAEDAPLREKLYPYRSETLRDPDDPGRFMDDYDKIPIERIVLSNPNTPGTILRLPMVYGPGDSQHRLFPYVKRMDDHRQAILFDERDAQWRSTYGYVENVADAIVLAVTNERAAGRIYNVAQPESLSMAEWVSKIGQIAGWNGRVVVVPHGRLPTHLTLEINADQHLVADSSRMREELGYQEKVPLEEALRRTIEWERANSPGEVDPKQFDYESEDEVLRIT